MQGSGARCCLAHIIAHQPAAQGCQRSCVESRWSCVGCGQQRVVCDRARGEGKTAAEEHLAAWLSAVPQSRSHVSERSRRAAGGTAHAARRTTREILCCHEGGLFVASVWICVTSSGVSIVMVQLC